MVVLLVRALLVDAAGAGCKDPHDLESPGRERVF